jgi:Zn-dependent M28 family amino/carboxypeptidase
VVFSPGADDNSSGVAALLEVARVLAGAPTRRTLRFCFFGAEEVGLQGSAAHLEALRADETRVIAALHLDSVGFRATAPGSQGAPDDIPWFLSVPDRGDFVLVAGNWSSGWVA